MNLVPFEMEHLRKIDPDEWSVRSVHSQDLRQQVGNALTLMEGEEVLGIGGLNARGDGAAYGFVLLSRQMKNYPVTLHKLAIRGIDSFMTLFGLKRLDVEVQSGFERGRRWVERMGFELKDESMGMARYSLWRP